MISGIAGCILAGGLSRRMGGGDKGEALIAGKTILARVIESLRPQVDLLCLNANGDPSRFAAYGLPIIADGLADHQGPLAGILAGLGWAEEQGFAWLVTVPGDTPFLPPDLVVRLKAMSHDGSALAASGGEVHHIVGLWPFSLRHGLQERLQSSSGRKAASWTSTLHPAIAEWPVTPYDPFLNINTPDDLALAVKIARENGL
jgi:molybdopterin-guanine dinucleotide biosynthesis protein A